MDKIKISYQAKAKINDIFNVHGEEIMSEVLAESINSDAVNGYQKEWNINGETVLLGVEKIR